MVSAGLCERDRELARVDALLAAARAGRGGMLLITGPAGIGKTVLLAAARERAGQAGMRVLAGRGGELESGFSFGVARQLFEPLLAGSAEREALLAGVARRALIALEGLGDQAGTAVPETGGEPPFAVVHGLYWLAVNASGAGPVLLAVDDLHWADQASLRFLLYLADRLAGLPVALALSWRTTEAEDGADRLGRLEQIAAGSVISLTPLSHSGVRALLTEEFGTAPADRFAAACHAMTGGNAFLLRELIQQLRADGIGPDEEAAPRVAALGPRSVARAVALRVARLGPAAREPAHRRPRAVARRAGPGPPLRRDAAGAAGQDRAAGGRRQTPPTGADRAGGIDRQRAAGRRAGRGRDEQSRDRPGAVRDAQHRGRPPAPRLPETGHQLP